MPLYIGSSQRSVSQNFTYGGDIQNLLKCKIAKIYLQTLFDWNVERIFRDYEAVGHISTHFIPWVIQRSRVVNIGNIPAQNQSIGKKCV